MKRYRNKLKYSKFILKLEKMISNWEDAKATDTHLFINHPFKTIWANIVIGVSRGVGFVFGVAVVGAILLTILGWIMSKFVSFPLVGEYIAIIVKHVQEYLGK